MNFVFDTNIVLLYLRRHELAKKIDIEYKPFSENNSAIISVVTLGELISIAYQNNWGDNKFKTLWTFSEKFLIADINVRDIVKKYAEIDAFSQGRHISLKSNFSARNMGKNDLWIAATASILKANLLSTDKDFSHLHNIFFNFSYINISPNR